MGKSVLQSTPIYHFSTLAFPKKYTNQIDAITTNFIWGFKNDKHSIHLAPRSTVFAPKIVGGLGHCSAHLTNIAL